MTTFHKKTLNKSTQIFIHVKDPCHSSDCDDPPLPPPPPPPPSKNESLSPFMILMFCGLSASFLFIFYLTLFRRYRNLRNSSRRNVSSTDETNEVFVDEDRGPVIHHHPIWLINTIGLEQSVIESIEVVKYRRDEGLIEGTDCSVCLSEFLDDESLRLLPKCSHAFHVPCIDTWLRSHKNCPLCRAPIIKNTSSNQRETTVDPSMIELRSMEENPDGDSQTVDRVERPISLVESSAFVNVHLADEERPKSGHTRKGSSSSISVFSGVMKSYSFGRSSTKATSFIKRSYSCSGNRSY